MRFDLLIRGGHLIDPSMGRSGPHDVGVADGRVAAVERQLPADSATTVLDATGHLVVPGLVDLHTHVYRGVGPYGVDADAFASRTGVTTWIDAGSSGAFDYPGFEAFIARPATVRIKAFLNISYVGLAGLNYDEFCNLEACDVQLLTRVARASNESLVGIKVRMGTGDVGNHGIEPLRRARLAAEELGLPLMVHISDAPPAVADVLALMRPGDVLTHAYTGLSERLVDGRGAVLEAAMGAREVGVLFDVGHGSGSFSFASAEAITAAGLWPDTISTDLHQMSLPGSALVRTAKQTTIADVRGMAAELSLPLVMTKFLALGMTLEDVIAAASDRPAAALGLRGVAGTLQVGAQADIAILRLVDEPVELEDVEGRVRRGRQRLEHVRTLIAGIPLDPAPRPAPAPWINHVDAVAAS
jgi:dihydroorotase